MSDPLHPNGKCRCAGQGECDWCVRTLAAEGFTVHAEQGDNPRDLTLRVTIDVEAQVTQLIETMAHTFELPLDVVDTEFMRAALRLLVTSGHCKPSDVCTLCGGLERVRGLTADLEPCIDPCVLCAPERCPDIHRALGQLKLEGVD